MRHHRLYFNWLCGIFVLAVGACFSNGSSTYSVPRSYCLADHTVSSFHGQSSLKAGQNGNEKKKKTHQEHHKTRVNKHQSFKIVMPEEITVSRFQSIVNSDFSSIISPDYYFLFFEEINPPPPKLV